MSKKISVILPCAKHTPSGGYKVIYEYINNILNLTNEYEFNVFYLCKCKKSMKCYLKKFYYNFFKKNFYEWSNLKKNKKVSHHIYMNKNLIKKSDILWVTAVETAVFAKKENLDLNKKVLYFIQHFEDWNLRKEEVIKTYHYGYKNIVVSKWLKNILEKNNAKVDLYLPNGVDKIFRKTKAIERRNLRSIFFLYHESKWKGSEEAINAMIKLKNIYNDLIVSCFSAFDKPKNFPDFIEFYKLPSREKLVELYNNHTFFLLSSYYEGFGLPAAEAMKCGCCVVTTKNGGVEDFAIHKKTAILVSSPPQVDEIVETFKILFENKNLVYKLSYNGEKEIQKFDYVKNTFKLLKLMKDKNESV